MWGTCFKNQTTRQLLKNKNKWKISFMYTEAEEKFFSLFVLSCGDEDGGVSNNIPSSWYLPKSWWIVIPETEWTFKIQFNTLPTQTFFHLSASQQVLSNHPSPRSTRDSYIIWIEAGIKKNQAWSIGKLKKQKNGVDITVNMLDR